MRRKPRQPRSSSYFLRSRNVRKIKSTDPALKNWDSPYWIVVISCLFLGAFLVLNPIIKSWRSEDIEPFDWFAFAGGIVLCLVSLLRRFSITLRGFEGETRGTRTNFFG